MAGLIEHVKKSREGNEEHGHYIKLGIDGGGGFLKVTLSILSRDPPPARSSNSFKDSGVKRLHIIALAPNLPEKYEYISLIWNNLLNLNALEYTVAGDLKIINVIVGIMAHSSSYPCPYCEIAKKDLAVQAGIPRTIGRIKEHSDKRAESIKRSDHASCIHAPLVSGDDADMILEICPPPPLHIKLGIVNAVFKAVEKRNPDWADLWAHKAQVRHLQRAYGFTGGACKDLIRAANILQDHEDLVGYFYVCKLNMIYVCMLNNHELYFKGPETF